MRIAAALLAAALATPGPVRAETSATCHCFRDRSFDPEAPAAVDPYLLATTRSSLLSAAFGVGKGELVRAVMSGTAPDDLWIAHWAGARTGRAAGALLASRRSTGSWRAALAGARDLGPLGGALARGAPDAVLAAAAVDDVLVSRLGIDEDSVAALRAAHARSDEAILASFLAPRLGTPAPVLLSRVRGGRATWGTSLRDAGLGPDAIDPTVRAEVSARRR